MSQDKRVERVMKEFWMVSSSAKDTVKAELFANRVKLGLDDKSLKLVIAVIDSSIDAAIGNGSRHLKQIVTKLISSE